MELKGTTALITGASSKLGHYIVKALALRGCRCICHYNRDRQKAEELVREVAGIGGEAVAIGADLTSMTGIEKLFEESLKFGTPRILINAASVFFRQPLEKVTFENARGVVDINLVAPVILSGLFAKKIKSEFADSTEVVGKIINISDVGGVRPWAGYVMYCSSKAGLNGATKGLAKELAPRVCVNSIAIGIAAWPQNFTEEQKKRQLSFIPLKRIAEPNEVTASVEFLLENDYITGQILNVDGGRCI